MRWAAMSQIPAPAVALPSLTVEETVVKIAELQQANNELQQRIEQLENRLRRGDWHTRRYIPRAEGGHVV